MGGNRITSAEINPTGSSYHCAATFMLKAVSTAPLLQPRSLPSSCLLYCLRATSEPILCSPRYDGTPFVVTTDGCMTGFAGVLSQWHDTVLPNGSTVHHL